MNVSDSLMIESKFFEKGWQKVGSLELADFVIYNTCAVREKAENKALSNIRCQKPFFTKKSNRRLAVIGCSAQNKKDEIKKIIPFVDYVIGPDEYRKFGDILEDYSNIKNGIFVEQKIEELYEDFTGNYIIKGLSADISIIRGCNNFCTYCIVPYTRGRERSRTAESIVDDVKKLYSDGIKEITLLGQNVNSFRDGDVNFPKLLKKIIDETEITRVRFLTSHPKDFNEELIDIMASDDRICNYIHLPVQAGSNKILKAMNRGYTKEEYLAKIKLLREKIPNIAISTDIITGFSGETEEDFQETLDLIKNVRYDSAFTFHYSKREGTKAAELMEDNVPETIKLERLRRLIDTQNIIVKDKNREMIGRTFIVLFDQKDGNIYRGKTVEGKIATVKSDENLIGLQRDVILTDLSVWTLK